MDRAILSVGVIILSMCLIATIKRNEVWRDSLTLWQDTTNKSPNKPRPLNNTGREYQRRGDKEKAIEYFSRAVLAAENNNAARSEARTNLALMYIENGQFNEAFEILSSAMADQPTLGSLHAMSLLALIGENPQAALDLTNDILRINPGWRTSPSLHMTRGQAFQMMGRCTEANMEYDTVRTLKPGTDTPDCP